MSKTNLQVSRLTATGWVQTGRGTNTGGGGTGGGTGAPLYAPTLTYDQVGAEATKIPRTAVTYANASAASWQQITGGSTGPTFLPLSNTVYSNLDIYGKLTSAVTVANTLYTARNVTFNNCRVRGFQISPWVSESTVGLVQLTNAVVGGWTLKDCTLIPDYPSPDWDCVLGHDFTLTRCLLAHGSDLIGMQNSANTTGPSGITLDTCYLNWVSFWTPEPAGTTPNPDAKSHNDCIQLSHPLKNITIKNSSISCSFSMNPGNGVIDDPFGYVGVGDTDPATIPAASDGTAPNNPYYPSPCGNASIQIDSKSAGSSWIIDGNYFDGGASGLNVSGAPSAFTCTNNFFGHNQRRAGSGSGFSIDYLGRVRPPSDQYYNDTATIINTAGLGYTISGNTYWDNGVPIHVR